MKTARSIKHLADIFLVLFVVCTLPFFALGIARGVEPWRLAECFLIWLGGLLGLLLFQAVGVGLEALLRIEAHLDRSSVEGEPS
jgi:hypothetical protein